MTSSHAHGTAAGPRRYVDWEEIGRGGSAIVYRVHDRELDTALAIKLLKPALQQDRAVLASLRSEVLISRALRHPNICPIHDLYEGPEGIGVVMDFLEGQDLRQWMAAHEDALLSTLEGRLTLLRQLATALAVAHQHIVHRDLKPANIFLKGGRLDRPLVMDFGLSRLAVNDAGPAVSGTPKYMAPEQYLTPHLVDVRADLFALGVVAYELMTGGQLPPCSLKDVVRTGQVPEVPPSEMLPPSRFCAAIPPMLDKLILQLLHRDPGSRPQSAEEVERRLAEATIDFGRIAGAGRERVEHERIAVPGGVYVLHAGLAAGETGGARRRVRLSPFTITRHPVTNRQYRAFLAATGRRRPDLIDHPSFGNDDHPVVMVSWDDAMLYAAWAGGRLPTEAEWEVAARAGDADAEYPWAGPAPEASQANIGRVYGTTSAVGAHPAGRNAWGVEDMCGNVWEWCADGWSPDFIRRLADEAPDPVAPETDEERSLRGGSFDSFVSMGRCAFRFHARRSVTRADIGFRIAFSE